MSQPRPVLRLSCAGWSIDVTAGKPWYVGIGPGCEVPLPLSGPAEPWFVVRHAGVWSARSIDDRTRLTLNRQDQASDRGVRIGDQYEQELRARRGGLAITLQIINPAVPTESVASLLQHRDHLRRASGASQAEGGPWGEDTVPAIAPADPGSAQPHSVDRGPVRPPSVALAPPHVVTHSPGGGEVSAPQPLDLVPRSVASPVPAGPEAEVVDPTSVAPTSVDPLLRSSEPGIRRRGRGASRVPARHVAPDDTLILDDPSPGPVTAAVVGASPVLPSDRAQARRANLRRMASDKHVLHMDAPDGNVSEEKAPDPARAPASAPPESPLVHEVSRVVDVASFLQLMSECRWPGRLTVLATRPGARPVRDHAVLLTRTLKVGRRSHDLLSVAPVPARVPGLCEPPTVFDLLQNSHGKFPAGLIVDHGLLLTTSGALMSWERPLQRSREVLLSPPPPVSGRLQAQVTAAELAEPELLSLLIETARRLLSGAS